MARKRTQRPTWQVLHCQGIVLSQRAIACGLKRGASALKRQARYSSLAERRFQQAIEATKTIKAIRESDLACVAILCDQVINAWREKPDDPGTRLGAMQHLERLMQKLLGLENDANRELLRRIGHQTAICNDFLTRIAGYQSPYRSNALELFYHERDTGGWLDNGRAYRSFLLALALASAQNRRYWAKLALGSAKECRDSKQALRARVVMCFGQKGENWLRRLQYPFA